MSENDIEDSLLELKEKYDPDDCRNCISIETMRGVEHLMINIRGMTSDTREWGGCSIFLDKERIEQIIQFLKEHVELLNKPETD